MKRGLLCAFARQGQTNEQSVSRETVRRGESCFYSTNICCILAQLIIFRSFGARSLGHCDDAHGIPNFRSEHICLSRCKSSFSMLAQTEAQTHANSESVSQ